MKILHLFSNWKWTGPAEPALNLCLALRKRGHQVSFFCGSAPKGCENFIGVKAIERGITPITELKLKKHFRCIDNLNDFFKLRKFIKNKQFDVVHTHQPNDHLIGGLAARNIDNNISIVRTSYSGVPLAYTVRNRFLFKKLTDGLITISETERSANIERFNLPGDIVLKVEGAIDLARFNPERQKPDLRECFSIGKDDVVVGIVARVQRHRQFDLLLKAVSLALKKFPGLKLLIIGRGTHIKEIAVEPVKEMNIQGNVIFSGYRNEDYADVLSCMDINIFLMPGSDGSCRAVREAMAMGKPVISTSRGILPELVVNGETGLIVEETPEDMANAILKLIDDRELRKKMGNASRSKALREFDLDDQAEIVEQFYQTLKGQRR